MYSTSSYTKMTILLGPNCQYVIKIIIRHQQVEYLCTLHGNVNQL